MSQNAGEAVRLEDAVLTRAAQAGDVAALGLLLERHRAGMRAVAVSILGPGPDVDDVVQDAAVTALRRVGDVRDPAAVGPWLRMIVRNASRSLLRGSVPFQPLDDLQVPSTDAGPERWPEHHAMRDWIWEANRRATRSARAAVGPTGTTPCRAPRTPAWPRCSSPRRGPVRGGPARGRAPGPR
ncbi:RNA polymerase sigma factor [Streptomyces sp. NBC_00191]|uniref:RNA polymerase sigma factor n=1 Tax=Streptomyces sp. NBC_00191 TaxID=2975674 RepID=UPI0038696D06